MALSFHGVHRRHSCWFWSIQAPLTLWTGSPLDCHGGAKTIPLTKAVGHILEGKYLSQWRKEICNECFWRWNDAVRMSFVCHRKKKPLLTIVSCGSVARASDLRTLNFYSGPAPYGWLGSLYVTLPLRPHFALSEKSVLMLSQGRGRWAVSQKRIKIPSIPFNVIEK